MSYDAMVGGLAEALDARCVDALSLVVIDGLPAGGKSSLAAAVEAALLERGRDTVTVENDWFLARAIRNPFAIASGLAIALSRGPIAEVERRLLDRFLDDTRLGKFQDELAAARDQLGTKDEVVIRPHGAFWNLQRVRPWCTTSASRGLPLARGGIVLIEGTLTAATYGGRFPDLLSVLVRVTPEVARGRFIERNDDPERRRNYAFSALALGTRPFRIAEQMICRQEYDFEVDLASLHAPSLRSAV